MKKIVLSLACAISFSFATTSEDNDSKKTEVLKDLIKKLEKLREPLIINYQEHFSNLSRNFS